MTALQTTFKCRLEEPQFWPTSRLVEPRGGEVALWLLDYWVESPIPGRSLANGAVWAQGTLDLKFCFEIGPRMFFMGYLSCHFGLPCMEYRPFLFLGQSSLSIRTSGLNTELLRATGRAIFRVDQFLYRSLHNLIPTSNIIHSAKKSRPKNISQSQGRPKNKYAAPTRWRGLHDKM